MRVAIDSCEQSRIEQAEKYYISKDYHGRRIDLPVHGDLQHARAVRDKLEEEKWNTHFARGYRWGGK